MNKEWLDAATFRNGKNGDMWQVDHSAHPCSTRASRTGARGC